MRSNVEKRCLLFNYKPWTSREFSASLAVELLGVACLQIISASCCDVYSAPVINGVAIAALIFAAGHMSGGHLNPLISAGATVLGYHPVCHCLGYILMQCAGSILGLQLLTDLLPGGQLLFDSGDGCPGCFDHTRIPSDVQGHQIVVWELLMTFMYVFCTLACGLDTPAAAGSHTPLVAGMAMVACAASGGRYTGAALNPTRVLGPMVVFGCGGNIAHHYVLGQVLGAMIATGAIYAAFRPGPLRPSVSREALGLSPWQATRLWLTGSPPGKDSIHDLRSQLARFYEGTAETLPTTSNSDLQRLFGADVETATLSASLSASGSQMSFPCERPREVALMLQHPEITHREMHEMLPESSPLSILR